MNGLPGLTDCAYGGFYDVNGEGVHTIMAQSRFSERIGYFSNPIVKLNGDKLGTASPPEECADNVSAINMAGPFVAGFRPRAFLNDAFADRTLLKGYGFNLTGDLTDSTREDNEPLHNPNRGAGSLWWSWTAPSTDEYEISFAGSSGMLAIVFYEGDTFSSLKTTAEFNNQSPNNPTTFHAKAGVTYQIAAASYLSNEAFVSFSITRPNDAFENPAILSGTQLIATSDSSHAGTEPREPNHGAINDFFGSSSNSVWWQWSAPATGPVQISTRGSLFGTNLGVYKGTILTDLELIAEDAYERDQPVAELTFPAQAGETYRIAVAGPGGLDIPGGFTVLSLAQTPQPNLRLSLERTTPSSLIIQVGGFTETDWIIETTEDFETWTESARFTSTDLPSQVEMTLEGTQRFFRARSIP